MKRSPETFKLMVKIAHGGMVTKAETAEAIASAILKDHHGEEEFARQLPLTTTDEGDGWSVRGSYDSPDWEPRGYGDWGIRIKKDDGRIASVGHRFPPIDPPDWVKALIKEERKRRGLDAD